MFLITYGNAYQKNYKTLVCNEKAGHFLPVADAPGRHLLLAVPRVFRGFSVAARVQHVLASQDGLELVLVDDTGSIILREGLGESGPPPVAPVVSSSMFVPVPASVPAGTFWLELRSGSGVIDRVQLEVLDLGAARGGIRRQLNQAVTPALVALFPARIRVPGRPLPLVRVTAGTGGSDLGAGQPLHGAPRRQRRGTHLTATITIL